MSVIKSWKKLFMRITQTQINDSALKITPSNKMCREIKTHAKYVNICINNWNTCRYTIESPIFSPNTCEHTKQFGCLWCAIMFGGKKKYIQITVRAIAYKQTPYSDAFDKKKAFAPCQASIKIHHVKIHYNMIRCFLFYYLIGAILSLSSW